MGHAPIIDPQQLPPGAGRGLSRSTWRGGRLAANRV